MKKLIWVCLTSLVVFLEGTLAATAQGTSAFTYQGRLNENGVPANGRYTLQFTLQSSETGGNPVGGPITVTTNIVNGSFTTDLDFGDAFNGDPRWLEVSVAPAPPGVAQAAATTATILSRVPIRAAPQASYARVATKASTADVATRTHTSDTATNAQFARVAERAMNADTATNADFARVAVLATTAGFATNSHTADMALIAGTAQLADTATNAHRALVAVTAMNADTATNAHLARVAVTAMTADTATNAVRAQVAVTAMTADLATRAQVAVTAMTSDLATRAQVAVMAQSADTAAVATNATLLNGLGSAAFAPASNSTMYVSKKGDFMTGRLSLTDDGLTVGGSQLAVANNRVGIGTASPDSLLTVHGGDLHIFGDRGLFFEGGTADPNYFLKPYPTADAAGMRLNGFGGVRLSTRLGDILNVTDDRVGIGTTNAAKALEVQRPGDAEIGVRSADAGGHLWTIQSSGVTGGNRDKTFQIIDRTANFVGMIIHTNGTVRMNGLLRSGSETTAEAPSPAGLVIRRVNSTDSAAGQIVARTDSLTLERDGTSGGFRIRYPANPGRITIALTGMKGVGILPQSFAPFAFYKGLDNPAAGGVLQLFVDSDLVVQFQLTFGRTWDSDQHLTQVTLSRFVTDLFQERDNFWSGTLTSTYNQ